MLFLTEKLLDKSPITKLKDKRTSSSSPNRQFNKKPTSSSDTLTIDIKACDEVSYLKTFSSSTHTYASIYTYTNIYIYTNTHRHMHTRIHSSSHTLTYSSYLIYKYL